MSHPTTDDIVIPKDLKDALNDTQVLMGYKAYLDSIYCAENLYFWMEIEVYQACKPEQLQKRADDIYHKYFSAESIFELNLPGAIVEELSRDIKNPATVTLYEKAQKSVFMTMEQDSWFRYQKSDMFKTHIEEVKERRSHANSEHRSHSENRHEFLSKLVTGFHDSFHWKKKKIFSGSAVMLHDVIKKNQHCDDGEKTPTGFEDEHHQSSPKETKKHDKDEESDSDDSDSNDDDTPKSNVLKMGILTTLLMPIHASVGSLVKTADHFEEKEFHENFKIEDHLISHYNCALKTTKGMLHQGKIYVADKHLCFSSLTSGSKVTSWGQIVAIDKATSFMIPNAIELKLINGKKFCFQSFVNREHCYKDMKRAWKEHNQTHDSL